MLVCNAHRGDKQAQPGGSGKLHSASRWLASAVSASPIPSPYYVCHGAEWASWVHGPHHEMQRYQDGETWPFNTNTNIPRALSCHAMLNLAATPCCPVLFCPCCPMPPHAPYTAMLSHAIMRVLCLPIYYPIQLSWQRSQRAAQRSAKGSRLLHL